MNQDPSYLLDPIRRLHRQLRDAVVAACERASLESLSAVDRDEEGDTIYSVDVIGENELIDFLNREVATGSPLVLIAEGIEGGRLILPSGATEDDAVWRIIVDPIDGTRGLMYQKRSAWILTGVAPNLGPQTSLKDITLAVQTEIPLVKQHLSDSLWAVRGKGWAAERTDRLRGVTAPIRLTPSKATSIAHGFASIARFFPGSKTETSAIDEDIVAGALGSVSRGKALCFEDQYISSGGQLYELIAGHDRFTADLRPLMEELLTASGRALGICCHPYDLCTELIAREAGVIVTDAFGSRLESLLSTDPDVHWAGYANNAIRRQIQPLLLSALETRGLLAPH